ncbi:MAG TPA: hypothetical protein VGK20_18215 [Candidatus Binatia bacterium]
MNVATMRRLAAALFVAVFSAAPVSPLALAADTQANAPRNGSRSHAADGTMVVYDGVNEMYVAPDRKDTFWIKNRFYHYEAGVWLASNAMAGPWEITPERYVPEAALGRFAPLKGGATATLPSGHQAVFEPRLKSYKVAGKKGVFLFDAVFYRYDNGLWLESDKEDGPWTPASARVLPVPLKKAVPPPDDGQSVTLPSGEKAVYDAKSRVFSLEDKPDVLLFDGEFYKKQDDKWQASSTTSSGFEEIEPNKVPGPVRIKDRASGTGTKKNDKKGEPKERKDKAAVQKREKDTSRPRRRQQNQKRREKGSGKDDSQPPPTSGD